jgi:hypothetical protein
MADLAALDRTWDFILRTMIAQGAAPHYAEVGRAFGIAPDAGRQLVRDLMSAGLPCWLYPGTDLIASFPPFNNQPTQYRLVVDGERKWFAQCGLEALAACWTFPGKTVRVEAPCLDCGEPLAVAVRDGRIEDAQPAGVCAYVSVPTREWRANLPHA